jgi:DNA-3-methyladenine glycosylase
VIVPGDPRPPPGARHPGRPGPFPRDHLEQPTLEAARALLGARLVRDAVPATDDEPGLARRVGRIVEIEAYIGEDDLASHARFGPTDRNRVMYGPPGTAYVYLVYGMHHCLNVVTEPAGRPAALLVRAVEPIDGIESMRIARQAHASGHRRARTPEGVPRRPTPDPRLAAGPGLVAAAFSITRGDTGADLCDPASALRLEAQPAAAPEPEMVAGPRVGIGYAAEPWMSVPWRFTVAGSPSISGRAR